MGKTFQVVLDDKLYKEYLAYKNPQSGIPFSQDKIARILKFSGGDILTNYAQYNSLDMPKDNKKLSALLKDGKNKNKTLEELAKATEYKIILTDDEQKNRYPYVNIDGDEIEMALGGFIMRGLSRAKALNHIKDLCADAITVVVYDSFFSWTSAKTQNNVNTLIDVLPKNRKLDITYHSDPKNGPHFSDECIKLINSKARNWNLSDRVLPDHHDRYIVINNTIEIILTSGFDHINNTNKEFSYIIRKYDNRFDNA